MDKVKEERLPKSSQAKQKKKNPTPHLKNHQVIFSSNFFLNPMPTILHNKQKKQNLKKIITV